MGPASCGAWAWCPLIPERASGGHPSLSVNGGGAGAPGRTNDRLASHGPHGPRLQAIAPQSCQDAFGAEVGTEVWHRPSRSRLVGPPRSISTVAWPRTCVLPRPESARGPDAVDPSTTEVWCEDATESGGVAAALGPARVE